MRPLYILALIVIGIFCLAHGFAVTGGWIVGIALLGFLLSGGQ